jgi:lipopolysaccharide transport system permease protein
MVGVIDGFRWCLLGSDVALFIPGFLLSVAASIALLFFGVRYFRKTERAFADLI